MSVNFKPWLVLGVIFVAGILTGVALTVALGSHFRHPPGDQQMKSHWMAHLTERLRLTTDQQAKIQPILTDAEAKIQSLHHEERQRGSQIFKAVDDQISALLTPEQQVELKKMQDERQKMFSSHMRSWGSPHDGPEDGMTPPPPAPTPQTNAPPAGPPPGP